MRFAPPSAVIPDLIRDLHAQMQRGPGSACRREAKGVRGGPAGCTPTPSPRASKGEGDKLKPFERSSHGLLTQNQSTGLILPSGPDRTYPRPLTPDYHPHTCRHGARMHTSSGGRLAGKV
jgi:hypothetical protein